LWSFSPGTASSIRTSPLAAGGGASDADEEVEAMLDVVIVLLDAEDWDVAVLADVGAFVVWTGVLVEEADPIDCGDDPPAVLGVEYVNNGGAMSTVADEDTTGPIGDQMKPS
jgi:hypothetical protein